MLIKLLLNKIRRFSSFFYGNSRFATVDSTDALIIAIKLRRSNKPECPKCGRRSKIHDSQQARLSVYRSGHSIVRELGSTILR